jgi:hypothetical protein
MRRRSSRIVAALTLQALVVVSTPLGAAELARFAITLTAGRIDPPRLEVPVNTRVKLTLRNAGGGAAEFEGRDVRVEKVRAPGANRSSCSRRLHPARTGSSTTSTRTRPTC